MYQFDNPYFLYLTLIIPVVIIINWFYMSWRKRIQKFFSNKELLDHISPNRSNFKLNLKLVFESFIILFLCIALANPKIGTELKSINREGVDIVFAIDVSKSMLAEDVAPNRLEKSKQLVTQIINNLASDRVGIIAYAGKAFPQLPITTDYASAKMFLRSMNTDMLSSQGTAIDDAIQLSRSYFDDEDQTNRVLIILSDGEDHNDLSVDTAGAAYEEGIKIYTIGVGSEKGGPIPLKKNGVIVSYKKDQNSETVITRLNEKTLKSIANEAKGSYIIGNQTADVVDQIKAVLNTMDKKEFEAKQFAEYKDQFQWFLGIGLFFLILDILLLERKTAWLKRLNLFNENL